MGPNAFPETASMRPRVFPAEDPAGDAQALVLPKLGFNEAAGIPRGRPWTATHPRRV